MRLEDYLKAIKPYTETNVDSDLSVEFGDLSNFPILLNGNFEELIRDFTQSEDVKNPLNNKYKLGKEFRRGSIKSIFYIPGQVVIAARNTPNEGGMITYDEPKLEHFNRQMKDYNLFWTLHPGHCGVKPIPGMYWQRVILKVIQDIGNYALYKKVPLCFPIQGESKDDHSRIVYFDPR